ncbi:YbaK/EbsC family protein [Anaerosinus massiliensis]|uniref:YbaK/EbsC family protein n=1 Tax=Massilibacillus massiliensis TaxID=1806837 RepID=UPI000DA63E64|nr:YbaK/EbsC family protein [Massilibacillus massiliensis]
MTIHEKLIALLEEHHCTYRLCSHEAEGRSEQIAKIRGNKPSQAMKAIVIMAKMSKKEKQYYLAIVPGDKMLDLDALKTYTNAPKVIFAPKENAKEITECEIGAIPPFSFQENLPLIVDPLVKQNEEIVFNAGELTKSIFMKLDDYIRIVNPPFVKIAKEP